MNFAEINSLQRNPLEQYFTLVILGSGLGYCQAWYGMEWYGMAVNIPAKVV